MTKKIALLLFICLVFSMGAMSEQIESAEVKDISLLDVRGRKDGVFLQRGKENPITAIPGIRLVDKDALTTGPATTAFMLADSDRVFQLDPYGSVVIETLTANKLVLTVQSGKLYFNIKTHLKEDETLDINTGGVTMSVRGTRGYFMSARDQFQVAIAEGLVDVMIGGDAYTVGEGRRLVAFRAADGTFSSVSVETLPKLNKGLSDFDTWTNKTMCSCPESGHLKLSCGHFECDPGSPHELVCDACNQFACNGSDHSTCGICGKRVCVGTHGKGVCDIKKPTPTKPPATPTPVPTDEPTHPPIPDPTAEPTPRPTRAPTPEPPPSPTPDPTPGEFYCPNCGARIDSPDEHRCACGIYHYCSPASPPTNHGGNGVPVP